VKKWRSTSQAIDATRRYLESEKGKMSHCKSAKKHRTNNRDKAIARNAVNNAIASGILKRPDFCQRCTKHNTPFVDGRSSIQAHHPDHSNHLDVVWLCVTCHRSAENE
jgi:hypothetical protein